MPNCVTIGSSSGPKISSAGRPSSKAPITTSVTIVAIMNSVADPCSVPNSAAIFCGILAIVSDHEKVLAVPVDALHPFYAGVDSWRSLPGILTEQIAHFFQHYKDLEKGKSVKITGWADPEQTADLIRASIERYKAAG